MLQSVVRSGRYSILGRASTDIIKYGGFKIRSVCVIITHWLLSVLVAILNHTSCSALEIEQVLLDHPDVKECAVIGVPDDVYGERVGAIIVPKSTEQVKGRPLLVGTREWFPLYDHTTCSL